jgi:putative flavoprotein involved in K+ transport
MADYLEGYAAHFGLPVRTGIKVVALRRFGYGYALETTAGSLKASHVVIATGYDSPKVPAVAAELSPAIRQIPAIEYRNPRQLNGDVIVVGAGTSGVEVAMEAAQAGHRTVISGRGTGQIPTAAYVFGGRIFWFYANRVASIRTPIGRRMRPIILTHGAPLIRLKMRDARRAGVERRPRLTAVRDGMPVFEDGTTARADTIVWCTGFRRDYSWIEFGLETDHGMPCHRNGAVEGEPGLYFVGLQFQTRLASALIGGVGEDAAVVAETITNRLAVRSDSRKIAVAGA